MAESIIRKRRKSRKKFNNGSLRQGETSSFVWSSTLGPSKQMQSNSFEKEVEVHKELLLIFGRSKSKLCFKDEREKLYQHDDMAQVSLLQLSWRRYLKQTNVRMFLWSFI